MTLDSLATAAELPVEQVDGLLNGQVGGGVASRLGTATLIAQDFVDGDVKPAIATVLGMPVEEARELRQRLGREGAIGVLLGILIARET